MRVSSALVLVVVAFLGGCASKANVAAKAPASPHISVAMDEDTQRALLGEDEPVAVGTTTVTSAEVAPAPAASTTEETPLPEDRGSLSGPRVLRTWGADVDGIPTTRE